MWKIKNKNIYPIIWSKIQHYLYPYGISVILVSMYVWLDICYFGSDTEYGYGFPWITDMKTSNISFLLLIFKNANITFFLFGVWVLRKYLMRKTKNLCILKTCLFNKNSHVNIITQKTNKDLNRDWKETSFIQINKWHDTMKAEHHLFA